MIKIDNSRISQKDWGSVNKTAIGAKIAAAYGTGDANKAVVNENWAYVPSDAFEEDRLLQSKCKLPHHELIANTLILNRAGVIAAAKAIAGSRGGVSIPSGDMASVKRHLRRHYGDLEMTVPDYLK